MLSSMSRLQLTQRLPQLLIVRRPIVPQQSILHETDAFALDGMSNDAVRAAGFKRHSLEGVHDLFHRVAIYLAHRPTEGPPLCGQGLQVEHLLHRSKTLD